MKGKPISLRKPFTDILTEGKLSTRRNGIRLSKEGESNIVLLELMKDGLEGGQQVLPRWFRRASEYTED